MNKIDNKSCVHFDDNVKLNNFNGNSNLIYDDCYENQQTNESKGPGGYQLNHLYSCKCGIPEVVKLATNGPDIPLNNLKMDMVGLIVTSIKIQN